MSTEITTNRNNEIESISSEEVVDTHAIIIEDEGEKKKKKKKQAEENKSAQSMIRTMLSNLVSLSELADQKAALMISVNSITISIILTFIFTNNNFNQKLIFPTAFLICVSVFTIVFSVFATKPKLGIFSSKNFQPIDLLFFNSYAKLSVDEYREQMQHLMEDEKLLQVKLIDNIHAQGVVLKKKYKQIGIAYTIFLIGFPLAVVYFIYSVWMNNY
jgi:hypothetical protein